MNGGTEAKEKTTLGQRKEPKDNHMQQKLTNLYILVITKMQTWYGAFVFFSLSVANTYVTKKNTVDLN